MKKHATLFRGLLFAAVPLLSAFTGTVSALLFCYTPDLLTKPLTRLLFLFWVFCVCFSLLLLEKALTKQTNKPLRRQAIGIYLPATVLFLALTFFCYRGLSLSFSGILFTVGAFSAALFATGLLLLRVIFFLTERGLQSFSQKF